jgi:hypothetical protein
MLRGTFVTYGVPHKSFVLHSLPRLDSSDSLEAARQTVGKRDNGYLYLPSVESLIHVLQVRPVVCELNWFEDFNHPRKHAFMYAQRQFFFIGEEFSLGELLGSWHLVACGYHKSRWKQEWIRFQNCWGHDYPLVWMPLETVSGLWHSGQMEASIAA